MRYNNLRLSVEKDEDFESRLLLRWGTVVIIERLFRVTFRYRKKLRQKQHRNAAFAEVLFCSKE